MEPWDDKYFNEISDITIIVNNNEYYLNKYILDILQYFRLLFSNKYIESTYEQINLDVDEEAFIILLRILYYNQAKFLYKYYNLNINYVDNYINTLDMDSLLQVYELLDQFSDDIIIKNIRKILYSSFHEILNQGKHDLAEFILPNCLLTDCKDEDLNIINFMNIEINICALLDQYINTHPKLYKLLSDFCYFEYVG